MSKETKNPVGRPRLELDEDQIFKLASLNITVKDMAMVLNCSKSFLEGKYLDVINRGRANMRSSILRKQYEVGVTDGNVTMLIWMGKQHLDQSDKKDITVNDNRSIEELTTAELRQRVSDGLERIAETTGSERELH